MQRAVDRGFWISWHDLPKETEGEHIAWLHGTYIPKILSRPGVLWAAHFKTVLTAPGTHMLRTKDPAVPNGSDYVLIFGGESTMAFTKGVDAFRNGGASRLDRDLSDHDKQMLAMRKGELNGLADVAPESSFRGDIMLVQRPAPGDQHEPS